MAGISGMEGTLGRPLGRGLEGQVNAPPEVRADDPCISFDLTLQPQPPRWARGVPKAAALLSCGAPSLKTLHAGFSWAVSALVMCVIS